MATTITSTYAGEFADKYLAPAVISAPSADNLTVVSGFGKDTIVMGDMSGDSFALANFSCSWVGGDVNLAEITIALKKLQVQKEICKNDFEIWWENQKLGTSEHNMAFQSMTYADALLANFTNNLAANIEAQIWAGTGVGNAGQIDGLLLTLTGDATVNDVAAPAVGGITSANVIAELGKTLATVPNAVYSKLTGGEEGGIYTSTSVIRAYRSAMSALGYVDQYHASDVPLVFEGLKLIECPGMTDDYMVVALKSNLFVGTSLKDDWNRIAIVDREEYDLTENVRFSAKFKLNCNHGIGADCVLYTPA